MRLCSLLLVGALCGAPTLSCFAQGTQLWKQTRAEDFERGTANGVAIRSDGLIEIAPASRVVSTLQSTYAWALASDPQGNAYVAAGSPARVYKITPQGKVETLLETKELQAQAIAVAQDGTVFVATSPEGRIYRIPPQGTSAAAAQKAPSKRPARQNATPSNAQNVAQGTTGPATFAPFFDPKTRYIWALAVDNSGNVYAATGDNGEIFKIDPSGNGAVFFNSDEAHIRSLAFDNKGNLLAGSDGSGLVYRITPAGDAFVLYSADKKEITSLAVDNSGTIFVAAVGEKRAATPAATHVGVPVIPAAAIQGQAAPVPQFPIGTIFTTQNLGGSEVDSIAPDGTPKNLWSSKEDLVYALAFDSKGRLLIGTGNRGRIYALDPSAPAGEYLNLAKVSANQVTAFAQGTDGTVLAATSNLGKLVAIAPGAEQDGNFESDVFDAKTFARWGRMEVHGHGRYDMYLRTGNVDNPDRNWSNWSRVDIARDLPPDVPAARFAQWRAVLYPGATIDTVGVNYLPRNVAPVIDDVTVTVGARNNNPNTGNNAAAQSAAVNAVHEITVKWQAHDDNNDELLYSVYFRGAQESRWKLLRSGISEKQITVDPSLFPDGEYEVKVAASDAPSHAPEDALSGERVSSAFDVDSTPPRIDALQAVPDEVNGTLHISFRAADAYSPIKSAQFSLDAGDWRLADPVGGISDAKTETYDFNVWVGRAETSNAASTATAATKRKGKNANAPLPGANPNAAPLEHLVVVRVFDRYDNVATAKIVVRAGTPTTPAAAQP